MASKIALALVLLSVVYAHGVAGKMPSRKTSPGVKPMKVIQNKYGDIFDCVDMYQQPALKHPLLKNHQIQMRPSKLFEDDMKKDSHSNMGSEINADFEGCPEGSVPIIRYGKKARMVYEKPVLSSNKSHHWSSKYGDPTGYNFHYAGHSTKGHEYRGTEVGISAHGVPLDKAGQSSSAATQIINRRSSLEQLNVIEAGWIVDPSVSGDARTRLYTAWTVDSFRETGCYNVECPGFVQVDAHVAPGSPIEPLSVVDGPQYYITLFLHRDRESDNWWLEQTNGGKNIFIGYWPKEIFTTLNTFPFGEIQWSGVVGYRSGDTGPPMGSGQAERVPGKAAFFTNIKLLTGDYEKVDPFAFTGHGDVDRPDCYFVGNLEDSQGADEFIFYYGGVAGCRG